MSCLVGLSVLALPLSSALGLSSGQLVSAGLGWKVFVSDTQLETNTLV